MTMRRFIPLLFSIIVVTGCQKSPPPGAVPVKGRVLLADGSPLRSGRICFHPEGQPGGLEAFGEINREGKFKLTTYKLEDGAVPGRYVVTVDPYSYRNGNLEMPAKNTIPEQYWDAESSSLIVEIGPGENDLPPLQLR